MTLREYRLDIYPVTLHAAYSETDWTTLRETIPTLDEVSARGLTSRDGIHNDHGDDDCHVSILIQTKYGPAQTIASLTHESVHAAGAILEHIGIESIDPWSESHAYLAEFIAAWLWAGLPKGWDTP